MLQIKIFISVTFWSRIFNYLQHKIYILEKAYDFILERLGNDCTSDKSHDANPQAGESKTCFQFYGYCWKIYLIDV